MGASLGCSAKREPSVAINTTVSLREGDQMPIFGLGTWLSKAKGECYNACVVALASEYRLIDTAALYENEEDVGKALSESKLQRSEYFITSKLHSDLHGKEQATKAIDEQLAKLGLDYIDLYLIHTPKGGKVLETWDALVEAKKNGKLKAIGVSNFGVDQLKALKAAGREVPEVNQIELHVWNQQKETVEYMNQEGIAIMGYCPLARVKRFGKTKVAEVAKEIKVSEAQVCIRWSLQKGYITIPKSSNEKRIKENATVFDFTISNEQMEVLEKCNEDFKASNSVKNQDIPWDTVA